MERKNIYSIIIMVIMVIGIVLTYYSWELFIGWLPLWGALLLAEIMVLIAYSIDFIKDNL
jgi:fatty acid desaturase